MHDPKSVAGKRLPVEADVSLLVIGAGPAGIAAALEAARHGVGVTLVDEHPLDPGLIGLDVPLHFGGCAGAGVQNRGRLLEQVVAATPGLEEAFEQGIDVRLGVACWGLFANGPSVRWLPGVVAGLTDGERAWHVRCGQVIVAAGSRDSGLAFTGWERPGVAGAGAVRLLLDRYDAFDGRRLVVLGSDVAALDLARTALGRGLEVAAVVEVGAQPLGTDEQVEALIAAGVPILTRTMVADALGGVDRVEGVRLVSLDGGGARELACDTVVLATGAVPAVELVAAAGGTVEHRGELGGWVPVLDADQRTSIPGVLAVGDCAGVHAAKTLDAEIAREEARIAALAAVAGAGIRWWTPSPQPSPIARATGEGAAFDTAAHRAAWVAASVAVSGPDVQVCQCEEVSCRELLDVRAPRYLAADPAKVGGEGVLARLRGEGPVDQDHVKRLTRAGMGPCQGRRCREQITALLAGAAGVPLGEVPLATYRAPVRPLPLRVLAEWDEPEEVGEGWEIWFGVPTMWIPHWQFGPDGLPLPGAEEALP